MVTGRESFTLREAGGAMGVITGTPIRFQNETEEQAYASRAEFGAPTTRYVTWVSSCLAIATAASPKSAQACGELPGETRWPSRGTSPHPDSLEHVAATATE